MEKKNISVSLLFRRPTLAKKFKIFGALQNSHYILGDSSHMVPLQNKRNITTLVVNGVHILYMILTSDFYYK